MSGKNVFLASTFFVFVLFITVFIPYTKSVTQKYFSFASNENTNIPITITPIPTFTKLNLTNLNDIQINEDRLKKYLTVEAVLLGVIEHISLYFQDLNHATTIAFDPTRSWIPASTIKSYVVLEAFRQKRVGMIDFNNIITIKAENVVPTELETDEFPRLREGMQVTIKQLVEAMIIQSDNTAYNTLLDILDRRNINATLRNLGITETVVGEKLNLDDSQFQLDLTVPGRQSNTTTAKDLASFFHILYSHEVPDADEILGIFKQQKINSMIPALLPFQVAIAHKTGDWAPIYHDGGLVYKPQDPFILVIFSNSNDPSIIAKLAKVAYYQNADAVGKDVSFQTPQRNTKSISYQYILDDTYKKVLAASTVVTHNSIYTIQPGDSLWDISNKFYNTGDRWDDIAKRNYITDPLNLTPGQRLVIPLLQNMTQVPQTQTFPDITAADLGITQEDVSTSNQKANTIRSALITPNSPIYWLKRNFESMQLHNAKTDSEKMKVYLDFSRNRLSEIKRNLQENNIQNLDILLNDSEESLRQAALLVQKGKVSDLQALNLKQVADLHFSVFANMLSHISLSNKEKYIDEIYTFYSKDKKDIIPVTNTSSLANPLQQKPVIGTIKDINANTVTLQFDDGTSKEMVVSTETTTRDFTKPRSNEDRELYIGLRIAVIGQKTDDAKLFPLMILKNIPKELPDEHQGKVVQIDKSTNKIEIENNNGYKEDIKINNNTIIKSSDTGVTLDGIKAGSQVTVFGQLQNTQSISPTQSLSKETQTQTVPIINATSISVTNNSSGAQEKTVIPSVSPQQNTNQDSTTHDDNKKSNNTNKNTPPSQVQEKGEKK